jgi:Pyruvate/2-oxoacid:ferredoxin oxidoreductase delta subunit
MATRRIIEIEEEKCDGCGQCVTACAEGAIEIHNGKARLVAESYCDGLGACLGECPQDAIRVIEREADAYSEELVRERRAGLEAKRSLPTLSSGCPGAAVQSLIQGQTIASVRTSADDAVGGEPLPEASGLANWPIQLRLVPPNAPFLRGADLLLVADCVPFAMTEFHRLLHRRPVVIGCPKLDDAGAYVEKLSAMLATSEVRSLTVVHMEVPCCTGLLRIAEAAVQRSGRNVPLKNMIVSIRGRVIWICNRSGAVLLNSVALTPLRNRR